MPIEAKRMPFLNHFAELRKRLTIVVVVVFALTVVFYIQPIYTFLVKLLLSKVLVSLPDGQSLITNGPFEALTLRFQVGFFGALIVASPLILFEIFAFFAPALKERERTWVFPTIVAAIILFLLGVSFAYFVLLGPAFEWLAAQGAGVTQVLPRASEYMSGVGMLLVGFGVSFELPLVVFYLIGLNLMPYYRIRASWQFAYVIIFVVAAIATPDWSPYNMLGLAAALLLLYEGSLLAARLVFSRKIAQQCIDAAEEAKLYEEPTDDEEELAKRKKVQDRAAVARKKLAQEVPDA
jgi:sec-independent protein translocase protein TatC